MTPAPLRVAVVAPAIHQSGPATAAARHTIQALATDPRFAVAHFGADCTLPAIEHHTCQDAADLLIHPAYSAIDIAIFVAGSPHPLFDALFGNDQVRNIVRFGDAAWALWSPRQLDRLRRAQMLWVADPAGAEALHVQMFDPERIHLVPTPPLANAAPPTRLQGKQGTPLRLLALGTGDGWEDLVDAMTRLEPACGPIHLTVATSEPEAILRLRQRLAENGMDHTIQAVPLPGEAERQNLLDQAHTLMFPARQEGSAAPLLDALRAGCIPLATASLNRTSAAAGLGLIVPPGDPDALARALARLAHALPGAQRAPGEPLLPLDRGATSIEAFDRMARHQTSDDRGAVDNHIRRLLLPSHPGRLDAPKDLPKHPRAWLYLGDTIAGQQHHGTFENVGKLTAALFSATIAQPAALQMLPCVQPSATGGPFALEALSLRDAVTGLTIPSPARPPDTSDLFTPMPPAPGDHVLFAGPAWTAAHTALFDDLRGHGIRFSVLVDDIQPVLHSEYASDSHGTSADWLAHILAHAETIFVPSPLIGEQIRRWSFLADATLEATIMPIQFAPGRAEPAPPEARPEAWPETWNETAAAIARAMAADPRPLRQPIKRRHRVVPPLPSIAIGPALDQAAIWCTGDEPALSIVIINRNEADLVCGCIRRVLANTTGVRYEIIVVDNGSGSDDVARLSALGPGIRLIPLGTDRHEGEANNIAAEQATGQFLCLLGRNVLVQPGWLPPLRAALEAGAAAAAPLVPGAEALGLQTGGSLDTLGHRISATRLPPAHSGNRNLPADWLPASSLLIGRRMFLEAGGFDLGYEPAGYEDVDLCYRLRAQGHSLVLCPDSPIIQLAPAPPRDAEAAARRTAVQDVNRRKFVSRWGPDLRDPSAASQADFLRTMPEPAPAQARPKGRKAVLWTPYGLTPGGGERYLLSIAAILATDHEVTIVTPHPYSRLRLVNLGRIFEIDTRSCSTATHDAFLAMPPPDIMVTLGNQITPPTPARAANSLYICQFPFPDPVADSRAARNTLAGYRAIIAYSRYARAHIDAALYAHAFDPCPIEVVYPPVTQHAGCADRKKRIILSTGRFFAGGHNKRHDAMIAAFRLLLHRTGGVELHLAGSSLPDSENMAHLVRLQRAAEGMPIIFHVNASQQALSTLYKDAMIYWHAAGLGADLVASPGRAEHFGISIVEAMAAQCVPVVFDAAGPREIITHGVDGFLFSSEAELLETTAELLAPATSDRRISLGRAARQSAGRCSHDAFEARMRPLIDHHVA